MDSIAQKRAIVILRCCFVALTLSGLAMPTTHADTLDKIRKSGVLVEGYREAAPPFSFNDGGGQGPIGFTHDVCMSVALAVRRRLDLPALPIRQVRVTGQERTSLIRCGMIDLDCAPTTVTPERAKHVTFSIPYYAGSVRLLVAKESGIEGLASLHGKTVVVSAGTTSERLIRARQGAMGFQMLMVRDHDEAFRMLSTGRAQAMALDDILLAGLRARSQNPDQWRIVGEPLATERYALSLPLGDVRFKALVDGALRELFASGEIETLQRRWFQQPIGAKGFNLEMPPSSEVLQLWREEAVAKEEAASDVGNRAISCDRPAMRASIGPL